MKRVLTRALLHGIVSMTSLVAWAGGPRYVAGTSYFNASMTGKPIVWASGQVKYYTDLGNLSGLMSQSQANAMVAAAAAVWSAVPTAAVSLTSGGSLSEDVDGSDVSASVNNVVLPADIESTDTAKPIAVVYDEDGSVIDTFFGPGASSGATCQQDGVFTFVDNLSVAGNIAHALILVNGLCAMTAPEVTVMQYQLVRAFGQALGLDWSQTNEEMFANSEPTSEGLAGWPVMHPIERLCNASGVTCLPNGTTLRPDDIAALNRLYPVTAANLASFKNKELTAANTISVTGIVTFRNGQGMQGVNVVLRPMLPGTDLPDVRFTVTAVSGAYFRGNAGNMITGITDESGNELARFGSDDTEQEGYFDLSGIPVPAGDNPDTWQLSLEPVNPLYTNSASVGPYTTGQVQPSGTMPTIAIPGLAAGSSVIENVEVGNSAGDSLSGNDGVEAAPAVIPASGEWTARLAGYGHMSWLEWWTRANREFTVEAEALDDAGNNTLQKSQIVLGMWKGTDGMIASPITTTPQPFNGAIAGMTTMPVMTLADSEVRLGVADMRGDGRPDYLYRGRVLYADSVRPVLLPAGGGPIAILGMGFRANSVVTVNGVKATVTSVSPTEITAVAPPAAAVTGSVAVQVEDPQTLGIAVISGELSYGAQNTDTVAIVMAPSGAVALGAPLPFTVAVSNGPVPAAGATVTFTVMEGTATLGCGQSSCSVVTATNGTASLAVAANSTATTAVKASLANGASATTQFTAQPGAAQTISALTPNLYLAAGATVEWTPEGLVLKNGTPAANATVTWTPVTNGVRAPTSASLSGNNGIVTQQLAAGPLNTGRVVPVNACLTTGNTCALFNVVSVSPLTLQLAPIAGVAQNLAAGQSFAPVMLEVTDPAGDPVAGAVVTFYETLDAWTPACTAQAACAPAPLIAQQTVQIVAGADGTVNLNPIAAQDQVAEEAVRLYITAVTGSSAMLNFVLAQYP